MWAGLTSGTNTELFLSSFALTAGRSYNATDVVGVESRPKGTTSGSHRTAILATTSPCNSVTAVDVPCCQIQRGDHFSTPGQSPGSGTAPGVGSARGSGRFRGRVGPRWSDWIPGIRTTPARSMIRSRSCSPRDRGRRRRTRPVPGYGRRRIRRPGPAGASGPRRGPRPERGVSGRGGRVPRVDRRADGACRYGVELHEPVVGVARHDVETEHVGVERRHPVHVLDVHDDLRQRVERGHGRGIVPGRVNRSAAPMKVIGSVGCRFP